jgi:cytochrome b subunit of formate dehydrogenase
MFQTITLAVFLAILIGIAVHWAAFPISGKRRGGAEIVRTFVHLGSLLLIEQRLSLLGALKKLCYLVAAFCFVVLGITGFYPLLVRGEHISGYLMMIHATLAPVFAICLAILGVTWASRFRFDNADCPWLRRLLRSATRLRVPDADGPRARPAETVWKATFWLVVALAIPLILSIVLSMLPLFGTHGQNVLLAAHRWVAVLFAVVVIIHTYMAVRVRMTC